MFFLAKEKFLPEFFKKDMCFINPLKITYGIYFSAVFTAAYDKNITFFLF